MLLASFTFLFLHLALHSLGVYGCNLQADRRQKKIYRPTVECQKSSFFCLRRVKNTPSTLTYFSLAWMRTFLVNEWSKKEKKQKKWLKSPPSLRVQRCILQAFWRQKIYQPSVERQKSSFFALGGSKTLLVH